MEIEAIYEKGRLTFSRPIRFVSDRFKVRVQVPDGEIIGVQEPAEPAGAMEPGDDWLARLAVIRENNMKIPEDQLPEVTAKQGQCFPT